jgi:hypothetical protein
MNKIFNILEKSLPFVFGFCVLLFFGLVYPHHMHYHEQFQLFLTTPDFFLEIAAKPGGISDYLGMFLTQFFLFSWAGAAITALLIMSLQWLIHTIAHKIRPARAWFALSFIPPIFYWILLCNENFLTGGIVSILVALGAWLAYFYLKNTTTRRLYVMLAIPVIYWLAGGSVFIFTFGCLAVEWLRDESSRGRIMTTGLSILIMGLCLFTAKVILPQYPFARLIYGADFFRFPKTYPSGVWVMWLFCLVVPLSHLMLPAVFKKTRNLALAGIVTLIAVAGPGAYMISINTDTAKEDIMAYDHYVRMQQWDKAIARADRKAPSSPLSVACLNLSLCKSGMMSDYMFRYYQNGPEGLIPTFARDFTLPMVTGEVYYHLGFINTAQRFAFEAMESLPNYWKSGRALKRLAETNLINGQYAVARKYLEILQHTLFYKAWANHVIPYLEDEALIGGHPEWGNLRKHRTKTDFFDSEQEKDMMLGILLQQDLTHYMAYEYLLAYCLLTKDLERFVQYFPLGSELRYERLPYSYQEALLYHWSLSHEDPFRTVPYPISEDVMRNMATYQNLYLNSSNPEEVLKKNHSGTYWYYLHFRK